jgi:GNAT superfamily N-acetyltransferase
LSFPSAHQLFDVVERTWAPASARNLGPFTLRDGQNGGQRVSATTVNGPFHDDNVTEAEQAMSAIGQPDLFMIRDQDIELDHALSRRGYTVKDPVTIYACPCALICDIELPAMSGFAMWPALSISCDIWHEGGIGPDRLAVMDRVAEKKTTILARHSGRAAGSAFVAIHQNIAMIHAIEVLPNHRRHGVGRNIMVFAARWAMANQANYFSLAVTTANVAANALYSRLGMTVAGNYHYRIKE